jgi:hypothetical protein
VCGHPYIFIHIHTHISPFAEFFGDDAGLSLDARDTGKQNEGQLPEITHNLYCSLEEVGPLVSVWCGVHIYLHSSINEDVFAPLYTLIHIHV